MQKFKKNWLLFLLLFLSPVFVSGQSDPTSYHEDLFRNRPIQTGKLNRPFKTRLDMGWVNSFCNADPHYTSNTSGNWGYTFGIMEEIPVQRNSSILIGVEILEDGFSLDSYFFSPGNSFLYNGQEIYQHDINMNELHFPIEYKFLLTPVNYKKQSLFMTVGWEFRFISYSNAAVTNTTTGLLVWEEQKDITAVYYTFSPFASPIIEASMGYQKFALKKRKRGWFFAIEYDYGVSALRYSGNREGSNNILFKLNTLSFKLGMTR